MTEPPKDIQAVLAQDRKLRSAEHAVVEFARSLVSVLDDAGRPATAKELGRRLFAVDIEIEACAECMKANMDAIMRAMMGQP